MLVYIYVCVYVCMHACIDDIEDWSNDGHGRKKEMKERYKQGQYISRLSLDWEFSWHRSIHLSSCRLHVYRSRYEYINNSPLFLLWLHFSSENLPLLLELNVCYGLWIKCEVRTRSRSSGYRWCFLSFVCFYVEWRIASCRMILFIFLSVSRSCHQKESKKI